MQHQPSSAFAPSQGPSTPPHLDAELLRLDALLTRAHSLRDHFSLQCDRAYELFEPPAYDKSVLWQKGDSPNVWSSPDKLDGVGRVREKRFTYASHGVLDALKAKLGRWESLPVTCVVPARDITRIKTIIAGVEAWEAEQDRRLDACGYKAAERGSDEQYDIVNDLGRQIAAITARTPEGVSVKARALWGVSLKSVDLLEKYRFADLLAKTDLDVDEREELLTLSLMIDAARLAGGVADAPSEQRLAAE